MNVSLTPELEKFIQAKVSSGMYTSASEVVRESLRIMHTYDDVQQEKLKQLNNAIDVGLNQLAQGKRIDSADSYERLKAKIDLLVEQADPKAPN